MAERKIYSATLTRSLPLSDLTKHLEFRTDNGLERFDFTPGQFVSITATKEDGKPITRAYSIASEPHGDSTFELCLNRVQDGWMSNRLCDLAEGDRITWHGPHGLFVLKQPLFDSIFICTGTGVAPFRSMLRWMFEEPGRDGGRELWLVYGTRHADTIYYRDEFEELAQRHPNFHYIITLSRPHEGWTGPKGYVQERVREILATRPDNGVGNTHAYICGLNEMVSANREQLKSLGWDRKQIFFERYD